MIQRDGLGVWKIGREEGTEGETDRQMNRQTDEK